MSVTIVTIPTSERTDLLVPLVEELLIQDEMHQLWVWDNSKDQHVKAALPQHKKLLVMPARSLGIYQMWNRAWKMSLKCGTMVNLAILNDDIQIPDHFLSRMAHPLRMQDWWLVHPDWRIRVANDEHPPGHHVEQSEGTFKDGGMSGWAFMFRAEKYFEGLPLIDEQFEWWCGDDDLCQQIKLMGGKQGKVVGLPVDHIGEATADRHPELHSVKWADVERLKKKYGEEAWYKSAS